MKVEIYFKIPDGEECDRTFKYLQEHPKDIWDYEERVKHVFQENYDKRFALFHTKGFEPNFTAHWTNDDVLETRVTRLKFNIIQYKVTLREGATDPRILVDILRRCKCVQEGVVGGNWTIHAWYREWTADPGNDGQLYYQTNAGLNDILDSNRTYDKVLHLSDLLVRLQDLGSVI